MTSVRVIVPTVFALIAFVTPAVAVNSVTVKNTGPAPVQIGFDRGAPQTIAPRSAATVALSGGPHSTQCRFDGAYDGCNIEEQFTLGDGRNFTIELRPVYTLQHAVTLAQQGALRVETRRDTVWATRSRDVAGTDAECMDYERGKLGAVATKIRSQSALDQPAMAMQKLCNESRPVVSATVGGEKVYVEPKFLTFRERDGRPVQVRQ